MQHGDGSDAVVRSIAPQPFAGVGDMKRDVVIRYGTVVA